MNKKVDIVTHHFIRNLINPDETRLGNYCISIFNFKRRLDFLMKHYSIITPDLFIKAIKYDAPLPENAMLLTFDDGYIDHYVNVFPTLMEKGIKAFFFASAMPVFEKKMLNTNKIQLILDIKDKELLYYEVSRTIRSVCTGSTLRKLEEINNIDDLDEKEDIIWSHLEWELPRYAANRAIDMLFKRLIHTDEESLCEKYYMNLEQLMEMRQMGMHIGCHGYSHHCLGYVNDKTKSLEIDKSLKLMKLINGGSKDWIMCYPYGSVDKNLIAIIKIRGCIAGFTTIDGRADLQKDNPYTLPRMDITSERLETNL